VARTINVKKFAYPGQFLQSRFPHSYWKLGFTTSFACPWINNISTTEPEAISLVTQVLDGEVQKKLDYTEVSSGGTLAPAIRALSYAYIPTSSNLLIAYQIRPKIRCFPCSCQSESTIISCGPRGMQGVTNNIGIR